MTNEKALEIGKRIYLKHTSKAGDRVSEEDFIAYIKQANKALEKQIATSPFLEGDGYADGQLVYDTWICPCCNKDYEVDYDAYNYCPNCGQHIDWSDSSSSL